MELIKQLTEIKSEYNWTELGLNSDLISFLGDKVPMLTVKPSHLVLWDSFPSRHRPVAAWVHRPERPLYERFEISSQEAKKIEEKIKYMLMLCKSKWTWNKVDKKWFLFKCGFITLTLSDVQKHSDQWIKKNMLNDFLTRLRQMHSVNMYLWRAETQSNGNIHFHILINRFVHWKTVRKIWNGIQKKHGYLDLFFSKKGNYDANSTDIHSIRKIRNLSAYIAKYMKKGSEGKLDGCSQLDFGIYAVSSHYRLVEGRIWGCSYFLSKIRNMKLIVTEKIRVEIERVKEKYPVINSIGYYSEIIKASPKDWIDFAPNLWSKLKNYITEIYNQCDFDESFNIAAKKF